jgi:inositol oxygenase
MSPNPHTIAGVEAAKATTTNADASTDGFRDYEKLDEDHTVRKFYRENHKMQTLDHVLDSKQKYYNFNHKKCDIMELFIISDQIIDESDPDIHLSQLHHAIQTAERARSKYPSPDMEWFWFTAFIHDLGKILAHFGEPQWNVVGDTFPVGCEFCLNTNTFSEYFEANPDNQKYDRLGIYKENCGFDNVHFSFGHDDYLSKVLEYNGHSLPYEALYCIRYHSFYPWHKYSGYSYLANDNDLSLKKLLQDFQSCDLYSKDDDADIDSIATTTGLNYEELKEFYKQLADKFLGKDKILHL